MTRFSFNLRDEAGRETEEVALDLPSCHAAVREASRILVDVARDEIRDRTHFQLSLKVREENGPAILESQLRYAADWLCEEARDLDENKENQDKESKE